MTIDKAIEILNDLIGEGPYFGPDDRREAVKLGIEALIRHKNKDALSFMGMLQPLPGETEG